MSEWPGRKPGDPERERGVKGWEGRIGEERCTFRDVTIPENRSPRNDYKGRGIES